jgi:hypothetical protein
MGDDGIEIIDERVENAKNISMNVKNSIEITRLV